MRQSFYTNISFLLKYGSAFFAQYYIFYIVTFPMTRRYKPKTGHTLLNSFAKLKSETFIYLLKLVFKHPS